MDHIEPPPLFDEPEKWPRDTPTKKPNYVVIVGVIVIIALLASQWSGIMAYFHRLIPSEDIAWRTDLQAALTEARKASKPVLVNFTANGSPSCQMMDLDVWTDPKIQKLAPWFVPVRLDADLATTPPIADHYGVRTIPHILILDGHGAVLKEGAVMNRDEMLRFMEGALGN